MSVKWYDTKEKDQALGSNFATDVVNDLGISHLSSWVLGFLLCKIICSSYFMDLS